MNDEVLRSLVDRGAIEAVPADLESAQDAIRQADKYALWAKKMIRDPDSLDPDSMNVAGAAGLAWEATRKVADGLLALAGYRVKDGPERHVAALDGLCALLPVGVDRVAKGLSGLFRTRNAVFYRGDERPNPADVLSDLARLEQVQRTAVGIVASYTRPPSTGGGLKR